MTDVPLEGAMIAWTAAYEVPGHAGQCAELGYRPGAVEVGPWPDLSGWSDRHMSSDGACEAAWRAASDEGRLRLLLMIFVVMTVGDGVAPADAHRALRVIPEYRAALAPGLGVLMEEP